MSSSELSLAFIWAWRGVLVPEAAAPDASSERKTRDKPPFDQPASFVSRLVAHFDHARTHRIEFFLDIAFEQIEGLVEVTVRIDDLHAWLL